MTIAYYCLLQPKPVDSKEMAEFEKRSKVAKLNMVSSRSLAPIRRVQ